MSRKESCQIRKMTNQLSQDTSTGEQVITCRESGSQACAQLPEQGHKRDLVKKFLEGCFLCPVVSQGSSQLGLESGRGAVCEGKLGQAGTHWRLFPVSYFIKLQLLEPQIQSDLNGLKVAPPSAQDVSSVGKKNRAVHPNALWPRRGFTFSLQQDTLLGRADSLKVYQMSRNRTHSKGKSRACMEYV